MERYLSNKSLQHYYDRMKKETRNKKQDKRQESGVMDYLIEYFYKNGLCPKTRTKAGKPNFLPLVY